MTKPLNILLPLVAAAALFFADGCAENYGSCSDELRFALSDAVPGYFVVGGESYGFAADVADTLAGRHNRSIRMIGNLPTDSIKAGFANRTIDVAVVLADQRGELRGYPSEKFYTTNYVMMSRTGMRINDSSDFAAIVGRKRIKYNAGFGRTDSGKRILADTTLTAKLTETEQNGYNMAADLLAGRCDLFICEKSEAELVRYLYRGIKECYAFDDKVEVRLLFANLQERRLFSRFFHHFESSEEYADLVELYFGDTSVAKRFSQLRHRPTRVVGGISVWDEQIKRIAGNVGVDWRLMSAIACHESNFRNDLTSPRGAVGLMQITPIVAEEFKLDAETDLSNPETNIWLASKLVRKSSRTFGYGNMPSGDDLTAIVVASYNCGITRTLEAQRLIEEAGGNKNSWSEMEEMFRNMGDSTFVSANDVRGGRFRDYRITIAYVGRVMEKYGAYCSSVK